MKKEKTKKDPKSEERRTGVVLENIDSKLDLIVEGHRALDKKIDNLSGEMDKRFNEVDYKFGVVFERFDEVTGELHVIRNELKEKVGRDEFAFLEKKISQKI